MRAPFAVLRTGRAALALCAASAVAVLTCAAAAQDDLGFRLDTLLPALGLASAPAPSIAPAPEHPRAARRIWAASASRPLRIALARRGPGRKAAARRAHARAPAARPGPAAEPRAVFAKLAAPPRPALVSIYEDRTLRGGDAVMMADGVHVFRPSGAWPHRPGDFVRLRFTASLGWQLRRTLDAYDKNPPTRWSSEGSWTG